MKSSAEMTLNDRSSKAIPFWTDHNVLMDLDYLFSFFSPAGTNNGVTDYVRQEIRAIVGARQQGPRPTQQIQVGPGQSVSAADCEALGLYLEMPSGEIH